ncbi:MAG TPA: methylmalonyl-CoA mutase family protein [Chitinophagales bacterium]|nr:methylmalonyl-CoA mutase family protein [Chitinophagales bacterium]
MKKDQQLFSGFSAVTAQEWKNKIIEELRGKPFEDLIWHTREGFDIRPFYTAEDLEKIKISVPQKQNPGWEIRQDFVVMDFGDANKQATDALQAGADSIGFDVSKTTLSKSNLQKLLAGIDTSIHPVHFTGLKMKSLEKLVSVFTKKTSGSVEFADFSFEHLQMLAKYARRFPAFRFFTLSEHAFFSFIKSGSGGIPRSEGEGMGVRLSLSSDYFMEIARLRALRFISAQKNIPVFIHAENIPQKTAKGDEHCSILRATTTAMAAVIGGCDSLSLHASPLPGKSRAFSERIYRNIQLLLKHEAHLDEVINPAAGSYFIEVLTKKIADKCV